VRRADFLDSDSFFANEMESDAEQDAAACASMRHLCHNEAAGDDPARQ